MNSTIKFLSLISLLFVSCTMSTGENTPPSQLNEKMIHANGEELDDLVTEWTKIFWIEQEAGKSFTQADSLASLKALTKVSQHELNNQ